MEQDINQQVFDILYNGKLAWNVGKEQLYTEDKTITPGWCTRRSDTGGIFGVVGSRYMPLQNDQLVREFMEATKEFGLTNITGVAVNDGRKVVLKARIGDIRIGTDTVHRYITASNTHDGSAQVRLGMYNVVQVCTNGLMRELSSQQLALVKHTTNAADKMNWYIRNLPKVIKAEEEMMKSYQKLSEVKVNQKHIQALIESVYKVDTTLPKEEISAKRKAQVDRFDKALTSNGLNVHGDTLWGVLQAATFLNSRDTKGKISIDRQMSGHSMEMSEHTLETLLAMIDNPMYELETV